MSDPFVWFDLRTRHADVSRSFYEELFGWDVAEVAVGDDEQNEWSVEIEQSLAGREEARPRVEAELDPFSLADPDAVVRTLDAAGFADVTFTGVHEPVYYGPDVATALEWVRGFACTNEVLTSLDLASSQRALERLRETLVAHAGEDGVWFDSRAWIISARRR